MAPRRRRGGGPRGRKKPSVYVVVEAKGGLQKRMGKQEVCWEAKTAGGLKGSLTTNQERIHAVVGSLNPHLKVCSSPPPPTLVTASQGRTVRTGL